MTMRIDSSLRLENDSEPHGEGWWKWSVWVDGSPEDLAAVKSVTYRLHPTFPKPVVTVADHESKFRLSSAGWGEFSISAVAHMNDGRTVHLERWLDLGASDESSEQERHRPLVFLSYSIADNEVATSLSSGLEKHGLEVRTAEQCADAADDGVPRVDRELQEADAVVAIVSEPASRFVEQEALTAHERGRFVVPVVLGEAKLHGQLARLARFELAENGNVESLAQSIASRVKDHITADEG